MQEAPKEVLTQVGIGGYVCVVVWGVWAYASRLAGTFDRVRFSG